VARYSLEIKRSAARELERLPTKKDRRPVADRISRLAEEPRPPGAEKLVGGERYRVRQGLYRIVYEVDDTSRIVRVVKIGHRRDVYRA